MKEKLHSGISSRINLLTLSKHKKTVLTIIRDLHLPRHSNILDVGCGDGAMANMLADEGFKVTAIDPSPQKTASAQNSAHKAESQPDFSMGSPEDLSFDDETYDLVLAIGSLEYITWQRWAFQEISRVLKPGGYLLIISANRLSFMNLINPAWYWSEISSKLKSTFTRFGVTASETDISAANAVKYDPTDRNQYNAPEPQILSRINKNLLSVNYEIVKGNAIKQRKFGNELIILGQKRIVTADISRQPFFLNIGESLHRFESEHAKLLEDRRQWLKENPAYNSLKPDNIDKIMGDRQRILVVSPHPDDELIGCGGTLVKLLNQGRQVTVLHLTDGRNTAALADADSETAREARLQEAKIVSDYMGYSELVLWKIPDTQIESNKDNKKRFTDLLNRINPQIIFTPFVNDAHPDHRDANELLMWALKKQQPEHNDLILMGYECWSMLPAVAVCIITDEFDRKALALMKYKIAMRVVDYVGFCKNLNAYHYYTQYDKAGYAETFFATDTETFIRLQEAQRGFIGGNG